MKKLLSIVLALALALSLSVTAFAAGDENEGAGDDNNTTAAQDNTITPGTDGSPNPSSRDTTVNYTVAPAYTVTIPASVIIGGENNSNTVTVSAEGVKIATGKKVVVKLSGINVTTKEADGDTEFTVALTDNAKETLEYTVTASGNVVSSDSNNTNSTKSNETITLTNNIVLTVEAGLYNEADEDGNKTGASMGSTELTFALADTAVVKYAGVYKGTVTFTVSVVPVNNDTTGGDTGNTVS